MSDINWENLLPKPQGRLDARLDQPADEGAVPALEKTDSQEIWTG